MVKPEKSVLIEHILYNVLPDIHSKSKLYKVCLVEQRVCTCMSGGLSVIETMISCQGDKKYPQVRLWCFFSPNILKAINCILQEVGLKLNSS